MPSSSLYRYTGHRFSFSHATQMPIRCLSSFNTVFIIILTILVILLLLVVKFRRRRRRRRRGRCRWRRRCRCTCRSSSSIMVWINAKAHTDTDIHLHHNRHYAYYNDRYHLVTLLLQLVLPPSCCLRLSSSGARPSRDCVTSGTFLRALRTP